MTLAEYGIEGAPPGEPEAVGLNRPKRRQSSVKLTICAHYPQVCLIHYDFKPEQHDNPLLLATEQN
jgi:hypothetical protein